MIDLCGNPRTSSNPFRFDRNRWLYMSLRIATIPKFLSAPFNTMSISFRCFIPLLIVLHNREAVRIGSWLISDAIRFFHVWKLLWSVVDASLNRFTYFLWLCSKRFVRDSFSWRLMANLCPSLSTSLASGENSSLLIPIGLFQLWNGNGVWRFRFLLRGCLRLEFSCLVCRFGCFLCLQSFLWLSDCHCSLCCRSGLSSWVLLLNFAFVGLHPPVWFPSKYIRKKRNSYWST